MCQLYFMHHWLCEHQLDLKRVSCQLKDSGSVDCPISHEKVLVDGICPQCTPGAKAQILLPAGQRFATIDEVKDDDTIVAKWDAAVAMYSPEDQKRYGLVLPEEEWLFGIGFQHPPMPEPQRAPMPQSHNPAILASQQAPSPNQHPVLPPNQLPPAAGSMDQQPISSQYWNQSVVEPEQPAAKDQPKKGRQRKPRQTTKVLKSNASPLAQPRNLLDGRKWRLTGEPDDNVPFPDMERKSPIPSTPSPVSNQEPQGRVSIRGGDLTEADLEGKVRAWRKKMDLSNVAERRLWGWG